MALRLQGITMIWKRLLKMYLGGTGYCLAFWLFDFWVGKIQHSGAKFPGFDHFITMETTILALATAKVGLDELSRGGYTKARRTLKRWIIVLFVTPLILIPASVFFVPSTWYTPGSIWVSILGNSFFPFTVLSLATLPLALYLNHKQKESSTEPTVADAS